MSQFEVIEFDHFNKPVSEFKLVDLKTLDITSKIHDALSLMQEKNMGSMVITENGKLSGIMTERDLLHRFFSIPERTGESSIAEVMTPKPLVLNTTSTIAECIHLMCRRDFRHIPIVNEQGSPAHMVSINDVLRFIVDCFPNDISRHGTIFEWSRRDVQAQEESFSFDEKNEISGKLSGGIFLTPLKKLLYRKAVKVDESKSIQETLELMNAARCGSVIITQFETTVKGIITERDFLKKIYGKIDLEGKPIPVKDLMTPDPHCLFSEHLLAHAINNMFSCRYRNIILVDEEKFPLGIISLHDILMFIGEKIFQTDEFGSSNLAKS